MEQEDRISAIAGSFGLWQAGVFFLAALVKIPSAWHMLGVLFKAPDADFWCEQPESLSHVPMDVWINISHPAKKFKNEIKYYNPCEIYDVGYEDILHRHSLSEINVADYAQNFSRYADLRPCHGFHYGRNSMFRETVVTEWHLVCNRRILVNVSQFFYLLGILVGGFVAMTVIPRIGPRSVLLFGAIVQIIAGTATSFVPLLEMNITLRFTAACGCAFMFTAGYMICKDITWGRSRILTCVFYEWFWSFGVMSLPGLTLLFGTKSWRPLQIAISVPTVAILLVAFFFLPESPRWLLENGRIEEAERIVKRMAYVNCRPIPENGTLNLQKPQPSRSDKSDSKKPVENSKWLMWISLFVNNPGYIKMFAFHLLWATTIVTYYGALLNVKNLGRNLFLNIFIAGTAEMAGVTLGAIIILKAGRHKWTCLGVTLLMGGLNCYSSWFLFLDKNQDDIMPISYIWWHEWTLVGLAMMHRIAVACSLTLLQVTSLELIPSDKQSEGALSSVTFARICLLAAPFIGYLAIYGECVSLTAFGSLSILGGLSSLVLSVPEQVPKRASPKPTLSRTWKITGKQFAWTIDQEIHEMGNEYFNRSFIGD